MKKVLLLILDGYGKETKKIVSVNKWLWNKQK